MLKYIEVKHLDDTKKLGKRIYSYKSNNDY